MSVGFATYGTLYPHQIAVTLQSSVRGFVTNSFYKFGNVNAVNYANQTTNIGASVLFKQADAVIATAFGVTYYIIEEEQLIFKENQ